jgi:hypothetical protein
MTICWPEEIWFFYFFRQVFFDKRSDSNYISVSGLAKEQGLVLFDLEKVFNRDVFNRQFVFA